jgi:hypothetical protein
VIERDLGALDPDALEKVLHGNCARLYNLDLSALEGENSDI